MKLFYLIISSTLFISNIYAYTSDNAILKYYTKLEINNGKLIKKVEVDISIFNREGENLSEIYIPYSIKDEFKYLKAWIKKDGKKIKKLKKRDIKDISAISKYSLYQDYYYKNFILRHNQYPYIIHYEYKIIYDKFLQIADWYPVINFYTPTIEAVLELEVPTDYKIRVKTQKINNYTIDTTKNYVFYKWTSNYKSQILNEIFSAPKNTILPNVTIVPLNFEYGNSGSFENWKKYGKWQYNLIKDLNRLPESEKQKIKELTDSVNDKKQQVKILYHYLQDNTRYINVTIDIGGIKPYPASYVAKNKYGDCKALTNYMKSMLDFIGINSYYLNIYAGTIPKPIDISFPGQQFNHAILMIPFKKDTIWLECTSKTKPFGYLGTFTQNRLAFVIDKNNSHFVKTPSLTKNMTKELRIMNFDINLPKETNVNIFFKFRGKKYEQYSHIQANYSKHQKNKIFNEILPFENYKITDKKIQRKNRDSAFIIFNAKLSLKNYVKKYNEIIILKQVPINLPDFEKPKSRKNPLFFYYPINLIDSLIYKIPENYNFIQLSDTSISSKYGNYSIKFLIKKQQLYVCRHLVISKGKYYKNEYSKFYNFIQKILKIEAEKIIAFELKK